MSLVTILEHSGAKLERIRVVLGPSWSLLEPLGRVLGASWGDLEASWEGPGEPLGAVLGPL